MLFIVWTGGVKHVFQALGRHQHSAAMKRRKPWPSGGRYRRRLLKHPIDGSANKFTDRTVLVPGDGSQLL
jgi:hypothetical protein